MADPLPTHTIRISPRAKRPRLTISPQQGLVVVIPNGFSRRKVPAMLRTNRRWIDRHLAKLADSRPRDDANALPQRITLQAVNEDWTVTYRPSSSAAATALETSSNELLVTGAIDDIPAVGDSLRRWLKHKAREHLIFLLQTHADRLGLRFARTRIGLPRTRWGSCSGRGTISLSAKLLLLPPELMHYVLIHELCHLSRPNHSAAFWSLVGKHVDDLPAARRHLKNSRQHIPPWAEGQIAEECATGACLSAAPALASSSCRTNNALSDN